jgi:phosphonate transport system substrate-binding protein
VLLLSFGLVLQLTACTGSEATPSTSSVRIGVLPDESSDALRERFLPLFEFLSHDTGLAYELIIPESYDDLLTKFGAGQIDLAYFGGVTFVKANAGHGAIPIVMRDVDSRFTSVIIVHGESEMGMRDLRGKQMAFGSKLSTSGHLMPRHFLHNVHEITPEDHFKRIRYSGRHDLTAYWVRDGEVDVGAANSEVVSKMFEDGRLQQGDVRIIWTTPPFADYVWAAHPRVPESRRQAIQQAFLKLSVNDPQHEMVLSNLGAAGFYPASTKNFSLLTQVLASLNAD